MCGIVHHPTRRKDFTPERYSNLPVRAVVTIAGVCEDVHIPYLATALVLYFANEMANKQGFVFESIPFAVYDENLRFISNESSEAEDAIMHLAMAGSVRRTINEELAGAGLVFELGHCCDIQMWEKSREEEARGHSHDQNVYRADKLRELVIRSAVTLPAEKFVTKAQASGHTFAQGMHELVKKVSEETSLTSR